MALVQAVLAWALQILFWLMWVRFVVDLLRSANPAWRPRGVVLFLAEVALTATDPFIKLARRIIPTIRIGGVALDLAWTAVFLLIVFAQSLVRSL